MPTKYLDDTGLARYDSKIKQYISEELSPIGQALDNKIDTSGGTTVQSDFSLVHEQSTGKTSWFELSEVDKDQIYYPSVALGATSTSHSVSTFTKMEITSGEIKFVYKRQTYTCTVKVPLSLENKDVTLATMEDTRLFAHDITIGFMIGNRHRLTFRIYSRDAKSYTSLEEITEALTGERMWEGNRTVFVPMNLAIYSGNDNYNSWIIHLGSARLCWYDNELQINYDVIEGSNYYNNAINADSSHAYLYYGYVYVSEDPEYTDITDNVTEV